MVRALLPLLVLALGCKTQPPPEPPVPEAAVKCPPDSRLTTRKMPPDRLQTYCLDALATRVGPFLEESPLGRVKRTYRKGVPDGPLTIAATGAKKVHGLDAAGFTKRVDVPVQSPLLDRFFREEIGRMAQCVSSGDCVAIEDHGLLGCTPLVNREHAESAQKWAREYRGGELPKCLKTQAKPACQDGQCLLVYH